MLEQWHLEVERVFEQMVAWRRHLHENPEVSYKEEHTARMVADILAGYNIAVRRNVGGHGVVGRLQGSQLGPTIAFRADMDALPLQEENEVPYKSQVKGVMHACGHDAHTATLLGVAKILSQHKNELNGTVLFIFQPAEEQPPGGALAMIEEGVLKGVDYIFGTHLLSSLQLGKYTVPKGKATTSLDTFELTIQGEGGHSSSPQSAVNPIIVGVQIVNQIQSLATQKLDPTKPTVITITKFHAGDVTNVIPITAKITGTIRTFDEQIRKNIEKHIKLMIRNMIDIYGGDYTLNYSNSYPVQFNNPAVTDVIRNVLSNIKGAEVVDRPPVMASEDFGHYTKKVPGVYFFTGSSNENENTQFPHHHPRFDLDENAMKFAAKAFLSIADYYLVKKQNTAD